MSAWRDPTLWERGARVGVDPPRRGKAVICIEMWGYGVSDAEMVALAEEAKARIDRLVEEGRQ